LSFQGAGEGALLRSCSILALCASFAAPARADEASFAESRRWGGPSALTVPKGRVELGLLQSSRYGLTDRVELSVHPLWFFALPHAEGKLRYFEQGEFALAVRGRMSYPTIFLGLVAREGSGGLLPKASDPPIAVMLEADAIGTFALAPGALASLSLGLAVAPRESVTNEELPLLDFPFLYPRFASLHAPVVPRAALNLESALFLGFHLDAEFRGYVMPSLPDAGTALALEQALALEYRFGQRAAISLGMRVSEAEYPVGQRVHLLPYFDVRVGL
jgi:hypothetical protein